jgi:hypothetical protein
MRRDRSLTPRTDWFRVLADLQYAGHDNIEVAECLGVPAGTLYGWKSGSEPRHSDGHLLLVFWSEVTGKSFDDRPMHDPLAVAHG